MAPAWGDLGLSTFHPTASSSWVISASAPGAPGPTQRRVQEEELTGCFLEESRQLSLQMAARQAETRAALWQLLPTLQGEGRTLPGGPECR